MADRELDRRVEQLRDDFSAVRGTPFTHFFCPILHVDESSELCKGHIVPEAFETCNAWVPQRKDVDNFYGTVAEADFIAIVKDRSKDLSEIWLDPKLRKQHRPRIECDGRPIGHYFPKESKPVAGQTPAQIELIGPQGTKLYNMTIKMSPEEAKALHGKEVQLVMERDYRPAVVASALKVAHLTLFKMIGYEHVFSAAGIYLADILRSFFLKYASTERSKIADAMESYFRRYACMVLGLEVDLGCSGTVMDNRMFVCVGNSQGFFAIGVVVKVAGDSLCVFVPNNDGATIDTYFSFLKEPPSSIAVEEVQFFPADGQSPSHWCSVSGPHRFRLPHTLPNEHDEAEG